MKSRLFFLSGSILLFIAILLGAELNVAAANYPATGTINCPLARIRSGPGIDYSIVAILNNNSQTTILKQQNGWYQIQAAEIEGWVASNLIDINKQKSLQVLEKLANLRSGPGTSYDKVGETRQGDILTLLDVSGDWYRIRNSNGLEAYINSPLVEPVDNATPAMAAGLVATAPVKPSPLASPAAGKIRVKLNNNFLNLEQDPIIVNGRTLVPLRAIFEELGAAVDWDGSKQKVTARHASTVVELKIGSLHPTVNGQDCPLDVAAQIVNDRTLVPLRFVAESCGSQVSWDANTRIVSINTSTVAKATAVTIKEDQTNLRAEPSAISAKVDIARSGERLPVLAEKDGWYQVSRGGKSVWVASWLVNVESDSSSSITPVQATEDPAAAKSGNQSQPGSLSANSIHLQISKDSTGLRIMLAATEKLEPEIKAERGQISFICKNRHIAGVNLIEEKLGGQSFKAQASNLAGDTLISVSLPADLEYKILTEEGGCRHVVFIPNYITKIDHIPYGSVGERLIVSTLCPINHSEELQGDSLKIRLKNIKSGSSEKYTCSSELINKLEIASAADNPQDILISLATKELGKFSTATTGDNKDLNIFLFSKQAIKNRSRIVVLDPGHGGSEPGTHGQYLIEKDPNLEVGLKAGEILKSKGFQVEYTRCDDSYMELELRAALANDLNAAVFVSIHHNGANPAASGTETYFYAPLDNPELFMQKDERSRLANLIQNELVSHLGRNNRGVKDNKVLAVLHNTKMPSALAEIAFLTNPEEEQLVQQNAFKDQAAQAIANGIISYLRD